MTGLSKNPLFGAANKPLASFRLLRPIGWTLLSLVNMIVRVKSELLEVLPEGKAPGTVDDFEWGCMCGWRYRCARYIFAIYVSTG
jgi:hypothetical protein